MSGAVRRILPGAPSLLAAVLLWGCGGGSDDPASAPDASPDTGGDVVAPANVDAPPSAPTGTPDTPSADDVAADGTVDCADALPCTVTSEDGALTLRLTAAQGEQADDGGDFRVDLAVASARGGDVALTTATFAEAGEARLEAALVTIDGEGSRFGGSASATLEPATDAPASVEFLGSLPGGTERLDAVTLVLVGGARETRLRFLNVPAGADGGEVVDCRLALPCDWRSPDGELGVTVEDVAVRRFDDRERLVVVYTVTSVRAITLAAEGYARASGRSGGRFAQAVLEFGASRSRFGARLEATLAPGETIRATLGLDAASLPPYADDVLDTLRLSLFEVVEPRVPYLNPVFAELSIDG